MRVAITGAAGFLGGMLVERLASGGAVEMDGQRREVDEILACDVVEASLANLAARYPVVRPIVGEIGQKNVLESIAHAEPDLIVHFAAIVSSAAEEDFALGLRVNIDATMALIQSLAALPAPPVFIFASSVPTISVRPGKPNRAASSFASDIIREPLTGGVAVLPVGRDVRLHLASPLRAIDNVLHAIALKQAALEGDTTITLPGLSVSVGDMLATLRAEGGDVVADRVGHVPDQRIEAIVKTWPGGIETPRAERLGFDKDQSFGDVLGQFRQTLSTPV